MKDDLKCPYCKNINKATEDNRKELDVYGKVVIYCESCKKLYVLRDDGDGEYIALSR